MKTTKAEETRERILDAALRLFREHGFEKTTMRDVAAAADVATGAAYYYFRSKEELVMAFYVRAAGEAHAVLPARIAATTDLKKRVKAIVTLTFEQFAEHRELMAALLKSGIDPKHPLSPFGEETKPIREAQIDLYRRALDGANVTIPKDLAPHVPRLLWLYQLGLVAFWIFDESDGQRRTQTLTDGTLDLLVQLLKLGSLPLMGPVRKKVLNVLRAVDE